MEAEEAFFNTSDYKLGKKIGEGTFGTVYIAKNVESKKKYAAKLVNIEQNVFDGREQMLFLRESLILHKLDHPSIVKFIGINFKSFSDDEKLQPTIITEYLRQESLRDILNKERENESEREWSLTKKYINLLGISDAMRYLHEEGIVHRDLKPENILVDSNFYPRVCDFGLSKCFPESLTKSMEMIMSGDFGTPLYSPPEILRGEEIYDQTVDVYAFGMIAYEIVTGEQPFSELGKISSAIFSNKVNDGYRPKFKQSVPYKMQRLISRCWSRRKSERPTFEEIFNELSNDKTYFNEKLDENEIEEYLSQLNKSKERIIKNKSENKNRKEKEKEEEKLKAEVEKFKIKLSEYQEEHDSLCSSNEMFHESIYSLLGPKEKRNKAIKLLKISSEQGNRYASFIIGYLYETGFGVERNISESFKYYNISSKQGNPKGIFRVGRCYDHGIGVKQDFKKAKEY